ncbi:MAG: excinuclease ABC subunit UvrA [Bacteroidaceae bacterium]|nr:excinuclease ABC subunit UvrA [Bacteroidaceae bacterium]
MGRQENDWIELRGVRVNNLKNIDVKIPRDKFVVITGVSGSGKSSLAFDTLYAEGQRRYVESLSTYARQFMGRMAKPECDFIEGLPPAIAIEQKVISRNPRSTVGTSTEIYDYLRMLFARVGRTYSPVSGVEVKKHSTEDVVDCMKAHPVGTRFMVLTPLIPHGGRSRKEQLEMDMKQGFSRIEVDGNVVLIENYLAGAQESDIDAADIYLVIDRLVVNEERTTVSRLVDSSETALYEGGGKCLLKFLSVDGREPEIAEFSLRFEADGMEFEEPTDHFFSFNSPVGACPECEGFGKIMGIDENLVIPNTELSVYDGAVVCWRGEKMGEWKNEFVRRAERYNFPVFTPYYALTQEQKDLLWHGMPGEGKREMVCIDRFFDMLRENQYKIQYRVMLARYRGKTSCPVCHGNRLKREVEYVKIGGRSITELVSMPVSGLYEFFRNLHLTDHDAKVAKRLLMEIKSRLKFLIDVGLGYLTLNRLSNTLSGGESQRINLATSLGSSLVGSLYILDEPSIGLHSRDTQRLIQVLRELQKIGNTVVVVEHDEEFMRAADYIIDIGPEAGRLGGQVVYAGLPPKFSAADAPKINNSHTLDYLSGKDVIAVPQTYRPWNNYIDVKCARENNLKGIDVRFPLNVMTVVTGVSGSGKSTLVRDIFYRAMKRHFDEQCDRPGQFVGLEGDMVLVKAIDFVDQNPIGTSTRSNPVTYIGAYDEIRKLMASQQLAKQMGYTPAYFSFNTDGGRCEECKGEGTVTVEMQFMNDIVLECEACHGKRFKTEILDVKYEGQSINDILDMTVNQAVEFFSEHKQKKIVQKLKPLQDVGLGYIKLGQTSSTLSGGENQRVKLAYYLSQEKSVPTIFIFDEPTTGLHFHDIKKLLESFNSLIGRGHTIIIIEHNVDVIKCADHIIDLGPEGGDAGGFVVATGTPLDVAKCAHSYTGQFLADAAFRAGTFK